ncbi:hypothetical protein TNCV_2201771 [Trichonephila clavipes]|uniref:Uncharacterized protein n=1 Tax=Trichonephila clavipes TaxID=2585209 RepID=A0A8X6RBX9_TRICX|nr:hypothetical protein TNCV_2201771 [Trichonephila clavipes]
MCGRFKQQLSRTESIFQPSQVVPLLCEGRQKQRHGGRQDSTFAFHRRNKDKKETEQPAGFISASIHPHLSLRDTVLIWDVIPVERDKRTKGYSIDSKGSACCPARSICIMRFGSIIAIIRANNTKAVKSVLSHDGNLSNRGGNFRSLNVKK